MSSVNSKINFQNTNIQKLITPTITGRGTGSQSETPDLGTTVWDASNSKLYVGDGSTFVNVDNTNPPYTVGTPIFATNNNGLVITGSVIQAQTANVNNGGILTVIGQDLVGLKTFKTGIVVETGVLSSGYTGVFQSYAENNNFGTAAWTGAVSGAQLLAVEKVGKLVSIHSGGVTGVVTVAGLMTLTPNLGFTVTPSVNRSGRIAILNNNVYSMGAFQVSSAGVLQVGIGINTSGGLINFPVSAGTSGFVDGVLIYSQY
jgi:hypothetical protein